MFYNQISTNVVNNVFDKQTIIVNNMENDDDEIPRYNMFSVKKRKTEV
jgi:hypothetical protein